MQNNQDSPPRILCSTRLINLYSAGHLTSSVFMDVVHNYYFFWVGKL